MGDRPNPEEALLFEFMGLSFQTGAEVPEAFRTKYDPSKQSEVRKVVRDSDETEPQTLGYIWRFNGYWRGFAVCESGVERRGRTAEYVGTQLAKTYDRVHFIDPDAAPGPSWVVRPSKNEGDRYGVFAVHEGDYRKAVLLASFDSAETAAVWLVAHVHELA